MRISGKISDGIHDASKWLKLYAKAYETELGFAVFPGSLNLRCDTRFDWFDHRYSSIIKKFSLEKYGGDRDIMVIPCFLPDFDKFNCFLWVPFPEAKKPSTGKENTVELIGKEKIRDKFKLNNGDIVTVDFNLGI